MPGGTKGSRKAAGQGLRQYEAAAVLDLTTAQISLMVRRGQLQLLPDGSIDPTDPKLLRAQGIDPEAEPKRRSRKPKGQGLIVGAVSSDFIDLNFHRARSAKAKADLDELAYERHRGNLVDKRLVEETAVGLYAMVREGIEDAVERLASIMASRYGMPEPELRVLIGDHMHESLERLADEMEELAGA
jgi:hypothetical protein